MRRCRCPRLFVSVQQFSTPFRLRRASGSTLEGEKTAEWQPDLEVPQPFAKQEFTPADITEITPESRAFVSGKIANAKFGWFAPFENNRPLVFYGMHGGAEWTGAAFDPASGWLYVSANKLPWVVTIRRDQLLPARKPPLTAGNKTYLQYCSGCHGPDRDGAGMGPPLFTVPGRLRDEQVVQSFRRGRGSMPAIPVPEEKVQALLDFLFERDLPSPAPPANEHPGVKPPWGTLNAIDLNTGRIAWQVPLGEYEELTRKRTPENRHREFRRRNRHRRRCCLLCRNPRFEDPGF